MNINAVGNGYSASSYGQIASGRRINSASDDAAGLTQVQSIKEQTGALDQNASNAKDMNSLTKVTDGALSGIGDYLQSIYTASLKAMNGLTTDQEKNAIQQEIDGYMKGIEDIANGTTFNTKNLLNNDEELNAATNPDGTGSKVKGGNATLASLGIEGYNVTGDFDVNKITSALDKVNSMRSDSGASSNALDAAYERALNTSENLTGADSRLEDLDIGKAISEKKKNDVLDDYKNMMLRNQMQQESMITKMLQ